MAFVDLADVWAVSWPTDRFGRCDEIDPLWEEITGQSAKAAKGRGWLESIHKTDLPKVTAELEDAGKTGRAFRVVARLRRACGGFRRAMAIGAPRRVKGEFCGYVISVVEFDDKVETHLPGDQQNSLEVSGAPFLSKDGAALTVGAQERKRSIEALKASEERYRSLFETSRDGIASADMSGRIIEANPAFQQMLGYTLAELNSLTYQQLTPQKWHEMEAAILGDQVLPRGESSEYEKEYIRKDGTVFPVSLRTWTVTDDHGHIIGMRAFVRDISARKRAEAALQASERRFRAIFDHQLQYSVLLTPDGRVAEVSDSVCRTGVSRGDVIGKTFIDGPWWRDMPEMRAQWERQFEEALAQPGPVRAEGAYWSANGELRYALNTATAVRNEHGEVEYLVAEGIDITERKAAEEKLRASEARLARETVALSRLNDASARLWRMTDLRQGLQEMLAATIELLGANKGNVQILDAAKQVLTIEAQQGFEQEFLDFFREVSFEDDTPCGLALRNRKRIIVEDIEADPAFAPFLDIARAAEFRAVQAIPLIARDGTVLGALSTHWRSPHRPDEQDLRRLDLYARQAADFIEHCRMVQALSESKALVQAVFDSSPDPIFLKDRDGRLRLANPATFAVIGKPAEACIGRTDEELFANPADGQAIMATDRRVMESGRAETLEETVETPSGLRHYVSKKAPFRDAAGNIIGLIGVSRDVTEKKRAEAALRHSEKRYRTLVDAVSATTWRAAPSGLQMEPQPEWMAFTGQTAEEMLDEGWTKAIHPDDVAEVASKWREASTRGVAFQSEHRIRRHDGVWRWMRVQAAPIRAADGEIVEWFGMNIDITERREIEEKLRASEEALLDAQRSARAGVWDIDLLTNRTVWSEPYYELLGLPRSVEPSFENWLACIHPDDRTHVQAEYARTLETGDVQRMEFRIIRDGAVRWLQSHGRIIHDRAGRPLRLAGLTWDISDRKETELALRQSRDDLDRAQEVGKIGWWRLDLRENVLTWSDENHRIFGIPKGQPLTYESFLACVHPDDRDLLNERWRAGRRGEPYDVEHRIVVADQIKWVREKAYLEFDSAGVAVVGFGVTQDITDRKRAELALRQSQRQLELALEAGQLGFWDWDVPSGAVEFGGCWASMLGYEPGEIEPNVRAWERLVHRDEVEMVEARLAEHLEGRTQFYACEHRLRHKDGSWRWILDRGQVVERDAQGKPLRAIGTHADVTARHEAEDSLRWHSRRNELLSDTAARLLGSEDPQRLARELCENVMVFLGCDVFFNYLVDEDAGRLRLNACAGVPDDEARRIEWLDFGVAVCGCVAKEGQRLIAEDIQQQKDPRTQLVGTYGVQAYCCHPLRNDNCVIGTLSFGTRARARFNPDEIAVMKAVADLVAIAMRRVETERALREADRRKNEFIATLAHELRNPLAPIKNGLEVMRLAYAEDDSARRLREMMLRQVTHLVRLVDDLLDVSRISRGRIELRRESVDLAHVLDDAVAASQPLVTGAGHRLDVSLPGEPLPLHADPVRLTQVLTNLINNAAKYTEPGGRIDIAAARAGHEVVVSVRDTGIGLTPESLAHVFDLFTQIEAGRDRAQGGLGIGLSLARSLVEMHGGSLRAQSEGLGKGSKFTVRLPLAEANYDAA